MLRCSAIARHTHTHTRTHRCLPYMSALYVCLICLSHMPESHACMQACETRTCDQSARTGDFTTRFNHSFLLHLITPLSYKAFFFLIHYSSLQNIFFSLLFSSTLDHSSQLQSACSSKDKVPIVSKTKCLQFQRQSAYSFIVLQVTSYTVPIATNTNYL